MVQAPLEKVHLTLGGGGLVLIKIPFCGRHGYGWNCPEVSNKDGTMEPSLLLQTRLEIQITLENAEVSVCLTALSSPPPPPDVCTHLRRGAC